MPQDIYSILQQAREDDLAGNQSMALMKYRLFLKHEIADPQAWSDYAGLLLLMGRHEDSLLASTRALDIDPAHEPALINKAAVLVGASRFEEARAIYEALVSKHPDRVDLILHLQKCLYKMGDFASIESTLLHVLECDQNNLDALTLLATVNIRKNDPLKIELYLSKIIELKYHDDVLLWEKSTLLLKLGHFYDGFMLFEHRPGSRQIATFNKPIWNGEVFPERTLLLCWEQGLGDTIMMLRYGSLLKALGGDVIIKVQSPLADLAKTCLGFDRVITNSDPLPEFDFYLQMMSLPYVLGTELNTIPAEIPYLCVPPFVKHRDSIIERIKRSSNARNIGLVWAGGTLYKNDHIRSIPPDFLAPFEQCEGVTWYSLQRETPDLLPFGGIIPLADLMETFADTAFVVDSMDMIVTVDTSVAHLAGALGKPTILMLPFLNDWRWMFARSDSPWYPSIRIYRQPYEGAWSEVIDAVVSGLANC